MPLVQVPAVVQPLEVLVLGVLTMGPRGVRDRDMGMPLVGPYLP